MIRDESLYVATRFLLTFGCFTGSMSLRFQLVRHWEKMPTYQHTESIALMFSYIAVVIALWIIWPFNSVPTGSRGVVDTLKSWTTTAQRWT